MAKRTIATIKQYDYTSKEEFEKDINIMRKKGYNLIKNIDGLTQSEVIDDIWKYTAYFIKDTVVK